MASETRRKMSEKLETIRKIASINQKMIDRYEYWFRMKLPILISFSHQSCLVSLSLLPSTPLLLSYTVYNCFSLSGLEERIFRKLCYGLDYHCALLRLPSLLFLIMAPRYLRRYTTIAKVHYPSIWLWQRRPSEGTKNHGVAFFILARAWFVFISIRSTWYND